MKSLYICAVLALVVACVSAREVSSPKWVNVTVVPNVHENAHPINDHVSEFQNLYTYCFPLTERPLGSKYDASITFTFDGVVDELVMNFQSNGEEKFPYVNKDHNEKRMIEIMLHDVDGSNFNGWSDEAFNTHIAGMAYAKGANIVSAKLAVYAMFEETSGLECKKHHDDHEQHENDGHSQDAPMEFEEEGNVEDDNNNNVHEIDITVTPILYPGLTPATVRFIIFTTATFVGIMALFCCCAQTTSNMDEYDELTRMEEQLEATTVVDMQSIPNDEEAVLRRAQEESLRQYRYEEQMRAATAAPQRNVEQQQYMRVPVMSPELYAQYLAAAQSQGNH